MVIFSLLHALAAPPATVLEHKLDVRLDWGRRLSTTQTWKVRIDDPDACIAGLIAPPGLDGAMDNGAMILQDLFIIPETTVAGDIFTLVATQHGSRGPHSGIFETAPDLPVLSAEVVVTALGRQPLTVWADPLGDPVWSTRRGKQASITWANLSPQQEAQTVWSTWSDWQEAGKALSAQVDRLIASKSELGRDLAGDLDASNLPEIARRTFQHVALDLEASGHFRTARKAAAVSASRKGTAAERAVVLISMLRAAGYSAEPALLRHASATGTFPVTVPSPGMLDSPMVRARDRSRRTVWIDPASDSVAIPALPSAMVGATVWVPGDLPSRKVAPGVVDGHVMLTTTATIEPNGDVSWSTDISAKGTGLEAIRTLLRSLDPEGQEQALRRLVTIGRPDLDRFAVTTSGTVDPFKPFTIRLSGHDPKVFSPFGGGLKGTIVPVLGAAMAGWLPPNIRVEELIDVTPPNAYTVAAHTRPGPAYDPTAQVDRKVRRNGHRLRIDIDAIRPYTASTSTQDAGAAAFLGAKATEGVEVLLFPPASKAVVKAIGALDLPPVERQALQALLWWSVDQDKQAQKVLKKALKSTDVTDFLPPLTGWVDPADERPWRALLHLLPDEDTVAQVALIEAIETRNPSLALELARPLSQHLNSEVSVPALLIVMKHQPSQQTRNSLASRTDVTDPTLRERVKLAVAEFDVDHGQNLEETTKTLTEESPRSQLVRLGSIAKSLPRRALRTQILELQSEAPNQPAVFSRGAKLLGEGGFHTEALASALNAARVAYDDAELWADVSAFATQAGNLQLGIEAALRASDLIPDDVDLAKNLHHLAILARDAELEELARKRAPEIQKPEGPQSLDALTGIATQSELLSLLQFHEEEVAASPIYLALRAQLRRDAGFNDDAARDSINLQRVHGEPQGSALAFSATAGRVFGTGALSLLDDVSDPTARLTRLDYRLITGSGDARADARELREEPRGQNVLLAIGSPSEAAAKIEGWPQDLVNQTMRPPSGYRINPVLSAAKGVNAFSHADRQLAILIVHADTVLLPPPLASLFSPTSPPLEISEEGSELFELRDGYVPLYAARLRTDSRTTYGLGFTPEAARRALRDAPPP